MWIITLVALTSISLIGGMFFIECKIIGDLPESNSFRKWWRRNVIDKESEL